MFNALLAQTTNIQPRGVEQEPASGATMLLGVIILIFAIIAVAGVWKLFKKAGQPGWAAIIPIYNTYILLQIAEKPTWWLVFLLLSFIPVLGFFIALAFSVLIGIEVAKKFGKSEVFGAIVCGILGIGYAILGFGNAQYKGNTPVSDATTAA